MIIKKKAIKQKRNYYRPKVHTNQTTIYLSDKIESTWVKKATESGMTKKEWVSCAISDYNLPWIEESKKKEKPLSKRDQKQLESVYRRRRRGEFTPVSYTHLDVYKRQSLTDTILFFFAGFLFIIYYLKFILL